MTTQTQPIEVYYAATPNGRKITIMLEELGDVPYVIRPISIAKGEQFTPEFLAISPNNRIPAIVDPEGPEGRPISVFESGAILRYLAEKFGRFYGKSWTERVKIDEWLFWQVGGFGPMLGQANHFARYAQEKIPYAIKRYIDETNRLFRVLNTQLGKQAEAGKQYVAGDDISIADFAIFDWSNGYANYGIGDDDYPHWKAWNARMKERPGTAKALAITLPQPGSDLTKDLEAHKILFNQR